jgi:hypothetical protein
LAARWLAWSASGTIQESRWPSKSR